MSHARTMILAMAVSTATLIAQAAPAPIRWRVRLVVWLGGALLGVAL